MKSFRQNRYLEWFHCWKVFELQNWEQRIWYDNYILFLEDNPTKTKIFYFNFNNHNFIKTN